jgi:nicotinamide-nucleotide amidase
MAAIAGMSAAPGEVGKPALDYMIIVTGGEILEGVYSDAHTPFLTRTLRPLGGRCLGTMTVDDRAGDLKAALSFASERARLVIVTGGLGPTPNDITRETIADFTGIELKEHEEVVADMERRFSQPREQLRPNLRRQAMVPTSGGYLANSAGTAVGLLFESSNGMIAALPGPPRELQPMVERELVPLLRTRFGVRPPGATLTLRFAGVGQSQISQTLQEHVQLPPELVITSRFEAGRVDFTFSLPGQTGDQAWLNELARVMRVELGDHLYAENDTTLEEQVVLAFTRRGLTLAVIEIGSGGHLTSSFAGTPGVDRLLHGSVIVPSKSSLCRVLGLGENTLSAREIGQAARVRFEADVAVLIDLSATGVGGRDNVLVTWVDEGQRETRLPRGDASPDSLKVLTTRVLDWMWRQASIGGSMESVGTRVGAGPPEQDSRSREK